MQRIVRLLAAAFAVCVLAAGSALAAPGRNDVYSVAGVRVDATAANAREAREAARAQAYQIAFDRLIRRVATADEIARIGAPTVDPATLDRMVTGIDIEEERATATRYFARLGVNFNAQAARTFLRERGFAVLETRGAAVLIVPQVVGAAPAAQDAWRSAWADGGFGQELTPISVAPQTVSGAANWGVAEQAALAAGAGSVLFATARITGGGVAATLEEVGPDGAVIQRGQFTAPMTIGAQGLAPALQQLAASINETVQRDWKVKLAAGDAARVRVGAQALFRTGADWRRIKAALAEATRTIVSDVRIEAISPEGASLSFAYIGAQSDLSATLGRSGVAVEGQDTFLTLRLR